jgi:hypothetical protein
LTLRRILDYIAISHPLPGKFTGDTQGFRTALFSALKTIDLILLLRSIRSAFGDLPLPTSLGLIAQRPHSDYASEEKFRSALAGRPWQNLSAEFLSQWWAFFSCLSPEAYRFYLPALLTRAVQDFGDKSELTQAAVFLLCPSSSALYHQGDDKEFRAKQSVFTPEQYRAVCGFLGLVFDWLPERRSAAAQALRWGWDRLETKALAACRTYYHQRTTFTYPDLVPPDSPQAALSRDIRTAFARTPYPGDHQLCGSKPGDGPATFAMEFRGACWQSLHPEMLHRTALFVFSDAGMRYFLPAFLLADLHHGIPSGDTPGSPISHLTDGFCTPRKTRLVERRTDYDRRAYAVRRFSVFSREERLAIVRYLELPRNDDREAREVRQALETYWLPSVQNA